MHLLLVLLPGSANFVQHGIAAMAGRLSQKIAYIQGHSSNTPYVSGNPTTLQTMRHHLEILDEIDKLLADNGFEDERQQLESEIGAIATGSELCFRSGSKLLSLQNTERQFASVAGDLIKEFVSYCHANGLYPKSNYET